MLSTEWTLDHERIAYKAAHGYYLPGGDEADLVQEARIGVLKALRTWQPGRGKPLGTFAFLCARAEVVTAVKTATRKKHGPLNYGLRLDGPADSSDEDSCTLADLVRGGSDPADVAEARDGLRRILAAVGDLSGLEHECVVRVRLGGEPYDDVGQRKRVDNALQRADGKFAAAMAA